MNQPWLASSTVRGMFSEPDVQITKDGLKGGLVTGHMTDHVTNGNLVCQGTQSKLIMYEGNLDWESFIIPFECMANRYGWTERDRINWLFDSLHRPALRYLCMLTESGDMVFADIKGKLYQHFGVTCQVVFASPREGIAREYAEEVCRLADQAYKGVESHMVESTAVYTSLTGLKNK